jgi:hypothetical protein
MNSNLAWGLLAIAIMSLPLLYWAALLYKAGKIRIKLT